MALMMRTITRKHAMLVRASKPSNRGRGVVGLTVNKLPQTKEEHGARRGCGWVVTEVKMSPVDMGDNSKCGRQVQMSTPNNR
jgi:ribosomal protein L13E